MKEEILKLIEERVKTNGIVMSKKIGSGFFFFPDIYDTRTVNSMKDLYQLNREGFIAKEDLGTFLFNVFTT